jgi:hypothetical protein
MARDIDCAGRASMDDLARDVCGVVVVVEDREGGRWVWGMESGFE